MGAGPATDRLQFIISLRDRLSGPLRAVQGRVQALQLQVQRASGAIRSGFVLGTAAVVGLIGAMGSAIRFNRELGQVRALGVSAEGVRRLSQESLGLSNTFGIAASNVVNNARTIRAHMGDLGEPELVRITRAATLAGEAIGMPNAALQFAKSMDRIADAQKVLGINLTGAGGRALGPTALIERLRAQFGNIDTVAETGLIRRAFGDEALPLMTALINNASILRGNLADIGKTDLGRRLLETADPFDRMRRSVENLTIVWGSFLLPLVTPWVNAIAEMGVSMQAWANRFPNLTRLIGVLTIGALGLVLAIALVNIGIGVFTILMSPWVLAILAVVGALILLWGWGAEIAAWFAGLPGWVQAAVLAFAPFIAIPLLLAAHWDKVTAAVQTVWDWMQRLWNFLWYPLESLARLGLGDSLLDLGAPDRGAATAGLAAPEGLVVPGAARALQTINNGGSSRSIQIGKVEILNKERQDAQVFERQLHELALGY